MIDSLSQIALALLATIGLVLFLGYVAKRMQFGQTGSGREMSIVETLHLGSKERVFMLQVGAKRVLVGVTAQQITALGDVEGYAGAFDKALDKAVLAQIPESTPDQSKREEDFRG